MTTPELQQELATAEAAPKPLRMTYEEFIGWSGEDGRVEWVNGEVIIHIPPKTRHQNLLLLTANAFNSSNWTSAANINPSQ